MEIQELLSLSIEKGASDLHLTEGEPPLLRVDGALRRTDKAPLDRDELKRLIYSILTDMQKAEFEKELELDFSLALPDSGPFSGECAYAERFGRGGFKARPHRNPGFRNLKASSDNRDPGP